MWEIIECPNGFPPMTLVNSPAEVASILRLPWSQGYYLINRIQAA